MKMKLQKKSEVLREGYFKGLEQAQAVISMMLAESSGDGDRAPAILGVDGEGEIIVFLGWRGKNINDPDLFAHIEATRTVDQDEIDRETDMENMKYNYDYLWKEAGGLEGTGETVEEFLNSMLNGVMVGGEGRYLGHDTSYCYETYCAMDKLSPAQKRSLESCIGAQDKDWVDLACGSGAQGAGREKIDTSDWKCVIDPALVKEINDIIRHRNMRRNGEN